MVVEASPSIDRRYDELLRALYARELFGIKLGLGTTRRLLTSLGRPERDFSSVLVAGTNGKGSTAAMLAAILREAGWRVGLFTSPHLFDYRERIRINGVALTRQELFDLAHPLLPLMERFGATYFEAATALAFTHFARRGVDVAVVEVGLGGRLDATNVLPRPIAVITDVDRDHVDRLGSSLADIAWEKAGIIRSRGEAISGCARVVPARVIRRTARRRHAALRELGRDIDCEVIGLDVSGVAIRLQTGDAVHPLLKIPLLGTHQARNAALAVSAAERWAAPHGGLRPESIARGLSAARWPGRMEVIGTRPLTMVDVAHNPHGARAVAETLRLVFPEERPVVVFGCLAGKQYGPMIKALLLRAKSMVFTLPSASRPSVPPEALHRLACRQGAVAAVEPEPAKAIERARRLAGPEGMMLVTGSGYLVAEVMSCLGQGAAEAI